MAFFKKIGENVHAGYSNVLSIGNLLRLNTSKIIATFQISLKLIEQKSNK